MVKNCFEVLKRHVRICISFVYLKVLANEKRGGLRLVLFDRSSFKLFSLKFSSKMVQAPSCERPKTTQRTVFLLFANNYWFPITLLCLAAAHFWHRKLHWNIGIAHPPRYLRWREKSGLHNKSFQITLTIYATFGASAKVLHRYLYHRCSFISVISKVGDGPEKMRETNKKTNAMFGVSSKVLHRYL